MQITKEQFLPLCEFTPQASVLETLMRVNEQLGPESIDRVILREAYLHLPHLGQFDKDIHADKTVNAEIAYSFFNDTIASHEAIEAKYLRDNVQEDAGQHNVKYITNRNTISKFIKDQFEHYQNTVSHFSEQVNELESGINAGKIAHFIHALLHEEHVALVNGAQKIDLQSLQELMSKVLRQYALEIHEIDQSSFVEENMWLMEDELLTFLSYWLKECQNEHIYVLYARTNLKLAHFLKKLKVAGNSHLQHPSQQLEDLPGQETGLKAKEAQKQQLKEGQKESRPLQKIKKEFDVNGFLKSYRQNTEPPEQEHNDSKPIVKTRMDLLEENMHNLFAFGCKRRYAAPKGMTFDQIDLKSKTMDLENFINFCRHLEITNLVDQSILKEHFKIYALNLRQLDQQRFRNLIKRIIQLDQKVTQKLLNKNKFDTQKKSKEISKNKRGINNPSKYRFIIRPINGKDVGSIQNELEHKKVQKQKIKEEKVLKLPSNRNKSKHTHSKSERTFEERPLIFEARSPKQAGFDPEKFISDRQDDHLWDSYEAKIWTKDKSSKPNDISMLESVLSKRMQNGRKVLQKFSRRQLGQYE